MHWVTIIEEVLGAEVRNKYVEIDDKASLAANARLLCAILGDIQGRLSSIVSHVETLRLILST